MPSFRERGGGFPDQPLPRMFVVMVEHEEDGLLERCLEGDGGAFGPLDETMASEQCGPDEDCARHRLHDSVQSALMELSPDYRQVIILRHFAQLSYQEMSSVLEVPEKTVKSRLHTARQLLGGIFSKSGIALS